MNLRLLAASLAFLSISVAADTFRHGSHDLYTGDYNSDGHIDYLLKAKPVFVPIAGSILVPLYLDFGHEDIVLQADGSGGFTILNTPNPAGITWTAADNNLIAADFTGDGYKDLFIQGLANGDPSFIVKADDLGTGDADGLDLLDDTTFGYSLESSQGTVVTAQDTDGDGDAELVITPGSATTFYAHYDAGSFSIVLLGITTPSTLSAGDTPGAIPMSTGVSNSGFATITIPVRTPDGINGFSPALTLDYNSSRSTWLDENAQTDTILGYGWDITGFSRISRCHDRGGMANLPTVDLSTTDRLCLDGQFMVLVSSGNYWDVGAEYRLETDPKTKIIANGTASSLSFTVYRPDGSLHDYGNTADSQVSAAASNGSDYIWAISTSTDVSGNQIRYEYSDDSVNGQVYPIRIEYDGAEIRFEYAERPVSAQPSISFSGNGTAKRSVYLHTVTNSINGQAINEYRLKSVTTNDETRLEEVQFCGYDESGQSTTCLAKTTFAWSVIGQSPDQRSGVATVTDGLGAQTLFTLETQLQTASVKPGFSHVLTYPDQNNRSPVVNDHRIYVSEMKRSNGNGSATSRWTYEGFSIPYESDKGRGYLGMEGIVRIDHQGTNVGGGNNHTYIATHQSYPYIGQVAAVMTTSGAYDSQGQQRINQRREIHWDHLEWNPLQHAYAKVYNPFQNEVLTYQYEFDGTSAVEVGAIRDDLSLTSSNGLVTESTRTRKFGDSVTGSTLNSPFYGSIESIMTYSNDTSNWVIGFKTHQETRHFDATGASAGGSREVSYTQVSGEPRIDVETRFAGVTDRELATDYDYDSYGNLASVSISGSGISTRDVTINSYEDNHYASSVTNALNHTQLAEFDARFGTPDSVTDADGRETRIERDPIGRPELVTNPDNTTISFTYETCTSQCSGAFRVVVAASGQPTRRTTYDILSRPIKEETESLIANQWSTIDTEYDASGRVSKISLPYFNGGSANHIIYAYDGRNRRISESRPDGSSVHWEYVDGDLGGGQQGLKTIKTVKNTAAQLVSAKTKETLVNPRGQVKKVTDAVNDDAVITEYTYDGYGNLKTVKTDGNAATTTTINYDFAGFRESIVEPHTGTTSFEYNALGQITKQTDAKNQEMLFSYDLLGRLKERDDDGAYTNTWSYDPTNATGALYQRIKEDGADELFKETITYDSQGRPTDWDTVIDYGGLSNESLSMSQTYDSNGRVSSRTLPSGAEANYSYSSTGYLEEIRDHNNVLVQKAVTVNAFGQLTEENLGNGKTTTRVFDPHTGRITSIDTTGSLQDLEYTWRYDGHLDSSKRNGNTTDYNYDELDRLLSAELTGQNGRELTFDYDDLGNIQYKLSNITGDIDVTGYQYGASSAGPNAVTQVTVGGDVTTLTYDANGNVEKIDPTTGDERNFEYNTFNKPTRIYVGPSGTPDVDQYFAYGPDGFRYHKEERYLDGANTITTHTFYAGGYEKVLTTTDPTVKSYERSSLSETVLSVKTTNNNNLTTSEETLYQLRDHLGGVDVVTDSSGNVEQTLGYDPFGSRRTPDGTSDVTTAEMVAILAGTDEQSARGYTGHEHLDRTGVIHMNGRIYDPVIGRFLNADPIVQAPYYSQSHNRYSYVMNSSVSAADPTGYIGKSYFRDEAPPEADVYGPRRPSINGHSNGSAIMGSFINDMHMNGELLTQIRPGGRNAEVWVAAPESVPASPVESVNPVASVNPVESVEEVVDDSAQQGESQISSREILEGCDYDACAGIQPHVAVVPNPRIVATALVTGVVHAARVLKKQVKRVDFEGAKINRKSDGGQIMQVLVDRKPVFRVEVHPLPGDPTRTPTPHWHIAPDMKRHREFPAWFEDYIRRNFP